MNSARTNFESANTETNANVLRESLKSIALYGFVHAVPVSQFGLNENAEKVLLEQAENSSLQVSEAISTAENNLTLANSEANPELKVSACRFEP